MKDHFGPWRRCQSGNWERIQLEDRSAGVSTGTRGNGSYPYRYQGAGLECGCAAPPDDWWSAGSLQCGCPRWWPTVEHAKGLIDSELREAGYALLETRDEVMTWEILSS